MIDETHSERILEIIEGFVRQSAGERPELNDIIAAHPDLEQEIRFYFPVVALFEHAAETKVAYLTANQRYVPHDLYDGESFGRYLIQRQLGRGGMGTVYLATDTLLDRDVAIKIPHFKVGSDAEREVQITRFYREARTMAKLHHRNLCPVFDVGDVEGVHFISMAFVDGETLCEKINTNAIGHREAVVVIRKVAAVLKVAHEAGIVHRDLKPANVIVDRKGEPVIMDFGLAKYYSEGDSRLTDLGTVVGSPAYMAPEQLEGNPDQVDNRADVYSLGVMMFELLTGQVPFHGSTLKVLKNISSNDQPEFSSDAKIDAGLIAICKKAMSKQVHERYQSAAEVEAAILNWEAKSQPQDDFNEGPKRQSIFAGLIILTLLLPVLLMMFFPSNRQHDRPYRRFRAFGIIASVSARFCSTKKSRQPLISR